MSKSAALNSATQYTMPPEFGKNLGMECRNTRFPLPTLLSAGYEADSVCISMVPGKVSKVENRKCFYCFFEILSIVLMFMF